MWRKLAICNNLPLPHSVPNHLKNVVSLELAGHINMIVSTNVNLIVNAIFILVYISFYFFQKRFFQNVKRC